MHPTDATTPSPAPTEERETEAAVADWRSQLRFWVVSGVVLGLDLWSKQWAFRALDPHETRSIIPKVLEFRRSLNDGAVFGSFTGQVELFIVASLFALGFVFYLFARSPRTYRGLHIALGMILAGALGNLYDRAMIEADIVTITNADGRQGRIIGTLVSEPDAKVVRVGDWPEGTNVRSFDSQDVTLHQQGVVRDFIRIAAKFPSWVPKLGGRDVWPWVFNIADASLVCGVGVLLLTSWLGHGTREGS